MSNSFGSTVDTVLKQSLLDFKDQMSVYSTQPWSAENGHGYNEAEQFVMRDGPSTPGMTGRSLSTRQANTMEPRRNPDREIDMHSHTPVQCRFDGPRNKLSVSSAGVPPGMEYGCPPGRPPMPIENGYRDDNFHRDNRPYIDVDRNRTDLPGYYKGQSRSYGPGEVRSYHGGEGGYPPYENDGPGGVKCEFHHLLAYQGGSRGLLPLPTDDRNQGLRRGYDSYSLSPGSSWSPTDSSGSPNAYPPPPPGRLRHSESHPPDARRSFGVDRPPPAYSHSHLHNRSPTDGQWRAEPQRRPARPHPDDDGYFFPRRVESVGPPPYPPQLPNHLRDPRLHRGQPSPSCRGFSPQPHNQLQALSATCTFGSRVNSARRTTISQIYAEHSYFKKDDPDIDHEAASSKMCTIESQKDSKVEVLPRHMLSPIPPIFKTTKSTSISSRSEKAFESSDQRGGTCIPEPLPVDKSSIGSKEETSVNQDSTDIASSGIVKEPTSSGIVEEPASSGVVKEPPSLSTKDSPCSSDEECSLTKEGEVATDQSPQKQTTTCDHPNSPAVSLSSFEIDLDTEPESSSTSDEEEQSSGTSDDEILQPVPTSLDSSVKSGTAAMQTEIEADPSKVNQSNSRVLRNGRVLPPSTTSVTRRAPSVRLPLPRDGSSLPPKSEDNPKQPKTRRSRRLAVSQDAAIKNLEDKAEEATDNVESGEDTREGPLLRIGAKIKETGVQELSKEERMLKNMANARAVKAFKERKRRKRFFSGHVKKRTLIGQQRKLQPQCQRRKAAVNDFVPEILPSKSRTETATLQRRRQMEKEIEQHERERLETARPEDERQHSPSPVTAEPPDSSHEDDFSTGSVTSESMTTASSRDIDTASKGSLLDEFPSDIVLRCKRISSARSSSGDTPLHKVCRSGKYDMARYLLLVENLPVNVQDYAGWTPLHEACSSLNTRVAELLLQHGADANISATDGTRPIHDAIEVGSLELVKLLIQYGADPLAEQGEKTPAEFALEMDQPLIHDYLQSVIEERKAQQSKLASTSSQPVVAKAPTRKIEKKRNEWAGDDVAIPVDGYSDGDPKFGDELDHPLFYVSPIIEMSDIPFLPDVYNLEIVLGKNPRRHNFHLLQDVLKALKITESELKKKLLEINAVELTVAEIKFRLKNTFIYGNSLPYSLRNLPSDTKMKLIPLCDRLRSLFDIEVANMDD